MPVVQTFTIVFFKKDLLKLKPFNVCKLRKYFKDDLKNITDVKYNPDKASEKSVHPWSLIRPLVTSNKLVN